MPTIHSRTERRVHAERRTYDKIPSTRAPGLVMVPNSPKGPHELYIHIGLILLMPGVG